MKGRVKYLIALLSGIITLLGTNVAFASTNATFNQTVNAGALTSGIYLSDDATPVASPAVNFSAVNYSFQCQTATATLGDTNNKLNVTNLANGINTWNIAIAATGGAAATWSDGAGHTYKYNDSTGTTAGCTNGQMTVDPSVGTITNDCNSACTANASTVSKGTSAAFVSGTTDSVTLMSDSAGTAWEGYLTGVSLSQKIPPLQTTGSYTLPMTVTLSST